MNTFGGQRIIAIKTVLLDSNFRYKGLTSRNQWAFRQVKLYTKTFRNLILENGLILFGRSQKRGFGGGGVNKDCKTPTVLETFLHKMCQSANFSFKSGATMFEILL